MTTAFTQLMSPLSIRNLELANRIAATALGWNWAGVDDSANLPTPALAGYWGMRAAGGLGLIISEPQSVHPTSTPLPRVIENTSDRVIEPYRRVTDAVHQHPTKIVAQLNHNGLLGGTGYYSLPLWAPSAVRAPFGSIFPAGGGVIPHAMEEAEIAEIVESFAAAAQRCVAAGFDGIELNAAEGYLIAEFLSPLTNQRTDGYGGDPEKRRRFLTEIVDAIRARIGAEPILSVRLGPEHHLEGGLSIAEAAETAGALGRSGAVDFLTATPGYTPIMGEEPGAHSDVATELRRASGLPVIYTGWVDGPETAESLLGAGVADLIGMSRATLADPELPLKAADGRTTEIRPCLACNQVCTTEGAMCVVNPALARQGADPVPASDGAGSPRKVLVIGSGPAGMEAACQLARQGDSVTVWERESEVGGQLRVASHAPFRERLAVLADFYQAEAERLNVNVECGREANAHDVLDAGVDAVVIATGALGRMPSVPGLDQPHVTDVRSVLRGHVTPGERTVVVIGDAEHRFQGLTVAEFIAAQGKQVQVVTDANIAADLWDQTTRIETHRRLKAMGVQILTMTELTAVREHEVRLRNRYSLVEQSVEADTVVLAYGDDANSRLLAELQAQRNGTAVLSAGDVVAPRDIRAAIRDASLVTTAMSAKGATA